LAANGLHIEHMKAEGRDAYHGAGGSVVSPTATVAHDNCPVDNPFLEACPTTKAPSFDRMDNAVDLEKGNGVVSDRDSDSFSRSEPIQISGLDGRRHLCLFS
jgi:hypothetical protein